MVSTHTPHSDAVTVTVTLASHHITCAPHGQGADLRPLTSALHSLLFRLSRAPCHLPLSRPRICVRSRVSTPFPSNPTPALRYRCRSFSVLWSVVVSRLCVLWSVAVTTCMFLFVWMDACMRMQMLVCLFARMYACVHVHMHACV